MIEHWDEWRKRCAILRCGPAAQAALRGFAWARFVHYAGHLLDEDAVRARVPSAVDCWHLFESYLAVASPRSGRRYKEWLFARLERSKDPPLDVIQGGASLLVRTVVRAWLLNEGPQRRMCPLSAPVAEGEAGVLELEDLLPAPPEDSLEQAEIEQAAARLLPGCLAELTRAERLVLLAKQLGLPLYDPAVLRLAGVGRSRASILWRGVFQRVAALTRQRHPQEPRDWQLQLALLVSRKLGEKILFWGRVEKSTQPFFYMMEERRQCRRCHPHEAAIVS
jgi:hypothetical protein